MADTAEYVVKLKDQVSRPANKAAKSIDKFGNELKKTDRQMGRFIDKAGRMREANGRFVRGMNQSNSAIGKTARMLSFGIKGWVAYRAAVLAAQGVMGAVTRVASTERTIAMLDQLTHHGRETFDSVASMAANFGLDIDETAKSYANFLKLQFDDKQARKMIALGADLQALGNSADDVQGIFRAIGQIKSKGKLQAEELLQLAERGVSGSLIKDQIAKLMGIARDEVESAQQKGKVTADIGLEAIERALNVKLGQKTAGESGKKFVESTMVGMASKAKQQGKLFWINLARQSEEGVAKGMSGALKAMSKFGASKDGIKVTAALSNMFTGLGNALELVLPLMAEVGGQLIIGIKEGFGAFTDALGMNIASGEDWVAFLRTSIIPAARAVGQVIGAVAMVAVQVGKIVGLVFTGISMGVAGIADLVSKAWEIGKNIGKALLTGIKQSLGVASPAKELIKVGDYTGQGFEKGLERSMPDNIAPTIGSSGAITAGAARAASNSMVTNDVGGVTIQVTGSGDPNETAQATLRAFEEQLGAVVSRFSGEAAA